MPVLPLLERTLNAPCRSLTVLDLGCGSAAVGVLLAQTLPNCRAVVADDEGCGRLAELNLRASTPAVRSRINLAKMSSETVLFQEEMARQFDIIVITRQCFQDDRFWSIMDTAKSLTAQCPRTFLLLACKTDVERQKSLTKTLETQGFTETGWTTVPILLGFRSVASSNVRIAEFVRRSPKALEPAV